MNINHPITINQCTSCQVCGSICPKSAISIHLDIYGFYRPLVDESKCVNCSLCFNVCYKYSSINQSTIEELENCTILSAKAKNSDVLKKSSSGGAARALCDYFLKNGYKCIGVKYDIEREGASSFVTSDLEESQQFNGSKYTQSYTLEAFKYLIQNIRDDKYVVFGLPCQTYALDKYLRKVSKRDDVILIDLFCHGCPSLLLWHSYLKGIKKDNPIIKYNKVNFRSKKNGWHNYVLEFYNESSSVHASKKNGNAFFDLFFSNLLLCDSCYECNLRSNISYADIRIGDFWGDTYDLDEEGVSLVLCISKKGKVIMQSLSPLMEIKNHNAGDFLPFQSMGIHYERKVELRNSLFDILLDQDKNIKDAYSAYISSLSIRTRSLRLIKAILNFLPSNFVKFLRMLSHHIIRK